MQGCVPLFLAVWPNDSPRHLVLTPLIAATGKTSMPRPNTAAGERIREGGDLSRARLVCRRLGRAGLRTTGGGRRSVLRPRPRKVVLEL